MAWGPEGTLRPRKMNRPPYASTNIDGQGSVSKCWPRLRTAPVDLSIAPDAMRPSAQRVISHSGPRATLFWFVGPAASRFCIAIRQLLGAQMIATT